MVHQRPRQGDCKLVINLSNLVKTRSQILSKGLGTQLGGSVLAWRVQGTGALPEAHPKQNRGAGLLHIETVESSHEYEYFEICCHTLNTKFHLEKVYKKKI